jgi:hypothetical protein
MSVKEQAYQEMYSWLDNDKQGFKPAPPIGMHASAVEQWEAGATEAYSDYDKDEAQWLKIENFIVVVVKVWLVGALLAAMYFVPHPLIILLVGFLGLYLIRRWIK